MASTEPRHNLTAHMRERYGIDAQGWPHDLRALRAAERQMLRDPKSAERIQHALRSAPREVQG